MGGTNCSFSLKENQMRGIISEESPPLTRPFGFDELFAKTPPCFLLVLFLNHSAFFFFLHSISLQLVCFSCVGNLPSGCTAHCQIEMLRKKHTRCDRKVTLEFVPVSSVWTPQHSPPTSHPRYQATRVELVLSSSP